MSDGISVWTIVQAVLAVGTTVYQYRQQKKARREANARTLNHRPSGNGHPIPIVYGRAGVEAIMVYAQTSSNFPTPAAGVTMGTLATNANGRDNEYLLCQYVLSVGEIDAVETTLIDDKPLSSGRTASQCSIEFRVGGTASPMATGFTSERSAADKFTGLSYLTAVFFLDRDDPQFGGIPRVYQAVRGRKLKKITHSNGVFALSANETWTPNPARVLLDYLTNPDYGPGMALSDIDLPSFFRSQEIANQVMQGGTDAETPPADYLTNYNERFDTDYSDYADFWDDLDFNNSTDYSMANNTNIGLNMSNVPLHRYEFNGIVSSSRDFPTAIESILESMPGAAFFRAPSGKWKLVLPDSETTEANQTIATFTDADIVVPAAIGRNVEFNRLSVAFTNANKQMAADELTFPSLGSAVDTQLQTEDGGISLRQTIQAEGCNNKYHAYSIAAGAILMARRSVYTFTVRADGFLYEPGDIVRLNDDVANLDVYVRITSVRVLKNFDVVIEGLEFYRFDYSWIISDKEEVDLQSLSATPWQAHPPLKRYKAFEGRITEPDVASLAKPTAYLYSTITKTASAEEGWYPLDDSRLAYDPMQYVLYSITTKGQIYYDEDTGNIALEADDWGDPQIENEGVLTNMIFSIGSRPALLPKEDAYRG